VIDCLFIIRI